MTRPTIAFLTAGGLAPCLSSAVASLIEAYAVRAPEARMIGYCNGYAGLLAGEAIEIDPAMRAAAPRLHALGGSPLGNSRVKLTNVADCVARGLVAAGEDPLAVAARRLADDGVTILHTIGGDDTNGAAADLAAYLAREGHRLTVVGLPKTVDNDVVPIRQSLGAWTAAEEGARFASHVLAEHSANPRMLIVHEVMGRHCGWLTAATAHAYRAWLAGAGLPEWGEHSSARWDVHGVYVPERPIDLEREANRLRAAMDAHGCVNLFVSEGAGVDDIVAAMEAAGDTVPRDAFGHVKLDKVNPGAWFASRFAERIGAEKTLVQKSGYFARSAPANARDRALIAASAELAAKMALAGRSGVVGEDEEAGGRLALIAFERIAGGKPFDPSQPWFAALLAAIGQD